MISVATDWKDYELLDAGDEEKLERWGEYVLRRPDPQAIWRRSEIRDQKSGRDLWENPDMFYHRSAKGGGEWEIAHGANIPPDWEISYKDLKFNIRPTAFKHTGLFPEQASNWEWLITKINNEELPARPEENLLSVKAGGRIKNKIPNSNSQTPKVLNLFAYTGGATVACMSAGAHVTHVDASRGMTEVAKENIRLSNLDQTKVRFIVDDAVKFVEREIRRGNKYEGIIMDPPVYGRGPTGQLWEIEKDLTKLVDLCAQILSDKAIFFLVNAYATTFSSIALQNILSLALKNRKGEVSSGEVGLPISSTGLVLPCGLYARWELVN